MAYTNSVFFQLRYDLNNDKNLSNNVRKIGGRGTGIVAIDVPTNSAFAIAEIFSLASTSFSAHT